MKTTSGCRQRMKWAGQGSNRRRKPDIHPPFRPGPGWQVGDVSPVLRIRDVYPGSWFLPIPDHGSNQQQKREVKKIVVIPFFLVPNSTILKIILFLKCWRKTFGPVFKRITKCVPKLSKIWVWDPGSGKNLFRIPDPGPGVKKASDPGSASLDFTAPKHPAKNK